MCLIDPQAHTYVQPPNSNHLSNLFATLPRTAPRDEYTIYWDGGAKKLQLGSNNISEFHLLERNVLRRSLFRELDLYCVGVVYSRNGGS